IERSAIWRWQHPGGGCYSVRTPSKCRHCPNLVEVYPVIDFRAVGRKAIWNLVAFIIRELKGLATRGEHEEHLNDAAYRGTERHGVAIRRQPCVTPRLVFPPRLRYFFV